MSIKKEIFEIYRGNVALEKSMFDPWGFYITLFMGLALIIYGIYVKELFVSIVGLIIILLGLFAKYIYYPFIMRRLFPLTSDKNK
jgi:hypothetical protein